MGHEQAAKTRRTYSIRPATLADQPEILEMARHFVEGTDYRTIFGFNPDALALLLVAVLEHGVVFVASTEEGELVGMIAIAAFPHPIGGEPYADEVCWWVEPSHRMGLGPAMLGVAEEWTRQNGLSVLKMVAPAGSTVGRFYERSGYTALETAYVKRFTPC